MGELISLLVSKDEQKIRVQSNSFGAIWLVLDELVRQLQDPKNGH